MSSKKSFPLVYLEWCDASSYSENWLQIEDVLLWGEDDCIIRQSGFLIKETKEYILLAMCINPISKDNIKASGLFKIPKTWIKKRMTLIKAKII